jgi:hypothetical protein
MPHGDHHGAAALVTSAVTMPHVRSMRPFDERLVPDLLKGRGRLIGGDLDVGEEGSEQTIITLHSLHHGSDGYQHAHTQVGLTKKAYPCKCNREHKQE